MRKHVDEVDPRRPQQARASRRRPDDIEYGGRADADDRVAAVVRDCELARNVRQPPDGRGKGLVGLRDDRAGLKFADALRRHSELWRQLLVPVAERGDAHQVGRVRLCQERLRDRLDVDGINGAHVRIVEQHDQAAARAVCSCRDCAKRLDRNGTAVLSYGERVPCERRHRPTIVVDDGDREREELALTRAGC
jgi:hypothetical protein